MLQQHLLKQHYYEQIPTTEIKNKITEQREYLLSLYRQYKNTLTHKAELLYFERALKIHNLTRKRIPQLYGIPKAHKKMWCTTTSTPAFRPVVSCVNSVPEIFSKWADWRLKPLMKTFIPTIIRDSADCRNKLLKRFPNGVPANVKLFSIDAVGMYSNIDTNHAKHVMTNWFNQFRDRILELDENFPFELVLKVIYYIMSNNIIQFGNTFWKQLCGTAMGTSTAVNYANLYVGILKVSTILDKYKDYLSFYGRFIDDGIGTWTQSQGNNLAWHQFLADFNNYGILKWTNTGMVNKVIFLNMVIQINPLTRLLSFKSYGKESNLYLYIPPKSAHQPKMLRGMIIGRLLCFYDTAVGDKHWTEKCFNP